MTAKEKAKDMFDKMYDKVENIEVECSTYCMGGSFDRHIISKQCALIAVENEYNTLRGMLFNLRSCHVIESEKVYLFRLQKLIDEEQEVKQEIEKL